MPDRFYSRTGLPMVDMFFNSYATVLDAQRRAFSPEAMLRSPMDIGSGRAQRAQQVREVEVGATEQHVIPITKEELRIGKRQVQSAKAYRVSATVVEVPVEQQVNLRAETVVIERRPATGTTVRGGQTFQDQTIEVHEMYEEPVVGKVVTQAEELVIYKTLSERTAVVRETVRETRVDVEEQAVQPRQLQAGANEEFEAEFRAAAGSKPALVADRRSDEDNDAEQGNGDARRTRRNRE
jgi:uncharacterized protein (TIGR02271 family)